MQEQELVMEFAQTTNKISLTIIIFNNKITYNKPYPFQKNITLTKFKTSYDKLEKEMTKPLSEYDEIKTLIENQNNSITNLQNNIKPNKNILIQNKKNITNRK